MPAPELYPLQFVPILRDYLWGGRKLHDRFGKGSGHDGPLAESWELVDHAQSQSVISNGPLQGQTLHQVLADYGPQLVGKSTWEAIHRHDVPPSLRGRFPLLLKFLDAKIDLSIQVHPTDEQAALLSVPDKGKSEAWVVLEAEPGARILVGTKPGITVDDFRQAIERGTVAEMLHCCEPRPGDCIYCPAGTPHAIGGGLLLVEIQQASDTTFRVFDWNRVDARGHPRPLHVEQSLLTIDFGRGPVEPVRPRPLTATGEQLALTPYFEIRRWRTEDSLKMDPCDMFHIVAIIGGEAVVTARAESLMLTAGQVVLLPASLDSVRITPRGPVEILEFLPGSNDQGLQA